MPSFWNESFPSARTALKKYALMSYHIPLRSDHCRAARRCLSPATCMASLPWGVVIVDNSLMSSVFSLHLRSPPCCTPLCEPCHMHGQSALGGCHCGWVSQPAHHQFPSEGELPFRLQKFYQVENTRACLTTLSNTLHGPIIYTALNTNWCAQKQSFVNLQGQFTAALNTNWCAEKAQKQSFVNLQGHFRVKSTDILGPVHTSHCPCAKTYRYPTALWPLRTRVI